MGTQLQLLEERVSAVTERLSFLRGEIRKLEGSLAARGAERPTAAPPEGLAAENRRLHGERERIRERIRALIQEIDRAL